MQEVIQFLTDLKQNNHRDWFQDNRDRYESSRNKILFITEILINEIRRFDSDIPVMSPEDCLFRIYRDIRFSPDKTPYKTHFGSYISRGGRKSWRAGYYLHIDADSSFVSGGIYVPEKNMLKALRTAIFDQSETFLEIINRPEFKAIYPAIEGEKLKTNPKGFPAEFENIDLLRYKSYSFSMPLSKEQLESANLVDIAVNAFKTLFPANKFLNDALDNYL